MPRLKENDFAMDHDSISSRSSTGRQNSNDNMQDVNNKNESEDSPTIRLRVERAIRCQQERLFDQAEQVVPGEQTGSSDQSHNKQAFVYNGNLNHKQIKKFCRIDQKSHELLVRAICQFGLSARSYDRILRVARTIADLEPTKNIAYAHVAEALKYRLRTQSNEKKWQNSII